MDLKSYILKTFNSILTTKGFEIIESKWLYEWQKHPTIKPSYYQSRLPKGAKEYLQKFNPRLLALEDRYRAFNSDVTTPLVWTNTHVKEDDILFFRGDNAYVWQLRGPNMNIMSYALTYFYTKLIDKLGLLEILKEDDFFGNFTFGIDNRLISRDLLDSILEIQFLEKYLRLSVAKNITILDIGAGYGRLAHRMIVALPNILKYLCTDAVATSSFISEYYVRFRRIEGSVEVVPLDEIESILGKVKINIAVNVHSFSECQLSAINWWVALLEKYEVKYLMVVPNSVTVSGNHGGKNLLTSNDKDFGEIIKKHGYKLIVKDPKYIDPVVHKYAINPTYYYLFELQ
jgi:hypothetical protein